jgi:hypothetical protein
MAMTDDINSSFLGTIVAVAAIFLLVCVIAVDAWYKNVEQDVIAEKWDQNPNSWLIDMRTEQRANLNIAHQIAPRHYHVPVDVAMKILAERNGKAQGR